jgi:polar amino acid transport system permease protein
MTFDFLFWPKNREPSPFARIFNYLLAFALLTLVFTFAFQQSLYTWNWRAVFTYWRVFAQGWLITVAISAVALIISSTLGLFLALARRSRMLVLRYASRIYVELIRGTPLLVQISIFFYIVGTAFHVTNRYLAGALILSGFSGAYISEIIRAGIESVGKSQLESAKAIGLTRAQTYRFVIFPQAIRQILPSLAGQFVSLVKDSSLLSILGIEEFTWHAEGVNSATYSNLEGFLILAAGYLILTLPISLWTQTLETRHRFET